MWLATSRQFLGRNIDARPPARDLRSLRPRCSRLRRWRPSPAAAQADFYKGKTVELIISTGAGGGLDANGRIVARHLGNHIPGNPTVVAKNMPGAGHIRAANYVFSQAPKDGTTIGTFIPIFVMAQVLERSKSIQFNPANFQWLVSTSSSNSTVYVWHTTGVKIAGRRDAAAGADGRHRRRLLQRDLSDRAQQRASAPSSGW